MSAVQHTIGKALGRIGSTYEHPIIIDGHEDAEMSTVCGIGSRATSLEHRVRASYPNIVDLTGDDEVEKFLVAKYTTPTKPNAFPKKRGHHELTAADDDVDSPPVFRKRRQLNYVPDLAFDTPTKVGAAPKNLGWAYSHVDGNDAARRRANRDKRPEPSLDGTAFPFTDDHDPFSGAPMIASKKSQAKGKRVGVPTLPAPPTNLQNVWDYYAQTQERRQRAMVAARKRRGFSALRREMLEEDDRAFNFKAIKRNVNIPCNLPNDLGDVATRSLAKLRV